VQHPQDFSWPSRKQITTESGRNITHTLTPLQRYQIARLLPGLAIDAFPDIGATRRTYPSGSARTCLSRVKHDDVQVGGLFLEAVGCEGASNAAPNDDDISSLRQVLRRTVAKEDLGRLCEPVRLAWVVSWKPSGAVR
jgi:hypothetical protein